jgi:hypothetical protein
MGWGAFGVGDDSTGFSIWKFSGGRKYHSILSSFLTFFGNPPNSKRAASFFH